MRVWGLMLLPMSAWADEPKDQEDQRYRAVTTIEVTQSVKVDGQLVRPMVTPVADRVRATFASSVRLRDNFEDESSQSLSLVQ